MTTHTHDAFISHAGEDKDAVARPLAKALADRGWTAWLDELELTIGDSLSKRIDEALSCSRFGVVILSPHFFQKQWPRRELAGLAAREVSSGAKVILPVWHCVTREDIVGFSPTLADRLGASTADGIDAVADRLSKALGKAVEAATVTTFINAPAPPRTTDRVSRAQAMLLRHLQRVEAEKAEQVTRLSKPSPQTSPVLLSDRDSIGRNDPCWCGSGKRYKKCHGA